MGGDKLGQLGNDKATKKYEKNRIRMISEVERDGAY